MWWHNWLEWSVLAYAVALLFPLGVAFMSMTPPEFLLAKICFTITAVFFAARMGLTLAYSDHPPVTRVLLTIAVFGVIGMGWVESWRWVKGRQPAALISPAEIAFQNQIDLWIQEGEGIRDDFVDEYRRRERRELNSHIFWYRRTRIEDWRYRVATALNEQQFLRPAVRTHIMSTSGDRMSEPISRLRDLIRDWDRWRR